MKNSEKYIISEGMFDWLLKALVGKDRAAKINYYKAIAGDRKLSKLSKELEQKVAEIKKQVKISHHQDPNFDWEHLARLRRGL